MGRRSDLTIPQRREVVLMLLRRKEPSSLTCFDCASSFTVRDGCAPGVSGHRCPPPRHPHPFVEGACRREGTRSPHVATAAGRQPQNALTLFFP